MAPGQEIHREDLPPELQQANPAPREAANWESALKRWAEQQLAYGESRLLETAGPAFERILIQTALSYTGGHRQEAARLLGWGRNTLTRKIKELGMESD
jgi:two-component system nitrogen regulation response regulator GlnG